MIKKMIGKMFRKTVYVDTLYCNHNKNLNRVRTAGKEANCGLYSVGFLS